MTRRRSPRWMWLPHPCSRFLRTGWVQTLALILMLAAFAFPASAEWNEKVLYSFQGGSDGQTPAGGVVFDKAGNLYGVTYEGGSTCPSPGCGTIFQLSPGSGGRWSESVLYDFNGNQGSRPFGGAIIDGNGNLYGTTGYGGSGQCKLFGDVVGCGVVWKLSPPTQKGGQWTYAVLYNFQGDKDGQIPNGDLTLDKAGNLYGATLYGGGYGSCNAPYFQHCGTVFELCPPKEKGGEWSETVLSSFKGVADGEQFGDGANPNGGLLLDSGGAIYGTTYFGGNNQKNSCEGGVGGTGCGMVFRLVSRKGEGWKRQMLYRFQAGVNDGSNPAAGVTFGTDGKLYGTTYFGPANGFGIVFAITKPAGESQTPGTETVIYRFTDGTDGANPMSGLTFDTRGGEFYGTASSGSGGSIYGDVFRLRPPAAQGERWTFDTLYGFATKSGGGAPAAKLVSGSEGNFYSTTQAGGTGCNSCGTVFEVWP